MGFDKLHSRIESGIRPIKNIILAVASGALALMMFLTALDVAMRYLFNRPIPGGLELVEYMMAIVIPFAVTITAYRKAHIGVDLVMDRFTHATRAYVACVTTALECFLYAFITWQGYLHIAEQYHSGLTSAVLLIPHYPFVASLAMAFSLLTLITMATFLKHLTEVLSKWIHS